MTELKLDRTRAERQRRFYRNNKDRVNRERRRVYKERKEKDVCPRCEREPAAGRTLCQRCLNLAAKRKHKI